MPFSYRVSGDGRVFITWSGRIVTTLAGAEAERFLKRLKAAEDEAAVQLLLARVTGNFKRGNEKGR